MDSWFGGRSTELFIDLRGLQVPAGYSFSRSLFGRVKEDHADRTRQRHVGLMLVARLDDNRHSVITGSSVQIDPAGEARVNV